MINLLAKEPMMFLAWLMAIFYGITVHEFAHAWAASWQGDNTAKLLGRLTLNPFSHIDMWGILMLVFVGFGWGKPVPVNHYNLKNGKISDNIVSLAGISTNLLSVLVFGIIFKILFSHLNPVLLFLGYYGEVNLLAFFVAALIILNLILAIFNIIPIPPLDGSHVLFNILPSKYDDFKARLAKNGPFLLLILIMADLFLGIGIFSRLFYFFLNLISFIYNLF
ncbi:site-2 protease family protein [Patescibacteria group bacterium]|nr:site-2 protease family protein [Patescibacteria group bacterium]